MVGNKIYVEEGYDRFRRIPQFRYLSRYLNPMISKPLCTNIRHLKNELRANYVNLSFSIK